MIHLREQYFAVEVPEGAIGLDINDYRNGSELNYWLIEGAKETLIVKDLPPGNWQIVCTSKEVTASHAPQLFGYAMIGDYYAQETLNSLLTSKGCDLNKTYLILKKQ